MFLAKKLQVCLSFSFSYFLFWLPENNILYKYVVDDKYLSSPKYLVVKHLVVAPDKKSW